MQRRQYERLAEKLHRLAYELEHDARRLSDDYQQDSAALRAISSRLGSLARSMVHD
jgi:hypothetical protein